MQNLNPVQNRDQNPRKHRGSILTTLLATTALVGAGTGAAEAQVVIDGGAEVIDGGGGGTQPSPWIVGAELIVGDTANGIMNVVNGGVVSSESAYLGNTASGVGTVGVTGVGSSWTLSDRLWVGDEGVGALTISDGGLVNNLIGNVGSGAGATGTVLITDPGSIWTLSQGLYLGGEGVGYVAVSNGGFFTSSTATIGDVAGSYGEITVNGPTSSWDIGTSGLYVGDAGEGVVNVQDGAAATLAGGSFDVARLAGAIGTVNVIGGGTLDVSAATFSYVGRAGNGRITVSDSTVYAPATYFGFLDGGVGTATISGASALWDGNGMTIGHSGTGDVTAENGATIALLGGPTLATNPGSSGNLTIDNATLTSDSYSIVSWYGDGQITVQNGGTLLTGDNAEAAYLGYGDSGSGTVTVTGPGSTWTGLGTVHVGYGGTGTLLFADGADVSLPDEILIGDLVDGTGSATFDNATLTAGNILVGNQGSGSFTISGGGTVTAEDFIVGDDTSASGSALVTGPGSDLILSVELNVGLAGSGTLEVADGGNVSLTDWIRVGSSATGNGSITIDGAGSAIATTASTIIGDAGTGSVVLSNGAAFYNDVETFIGSFGSGSLSLTGAGTSWENGDFFHIGVFGDGSVSVSDGATVSNAGDLYLGGFSSSTGTLTVDGAGAVWSNGGEICVGDQGIGTITIANGATMTSGNGHIGQNAGSSGDVLVDGSGSAWTITGPAWVGESGSGTITAANGAVVTADSFEVAVNTGAIGALHIGAAQGDSAQGAGSFAASAVNFGAGTGALVFNHTDAGYGFALPVTGDGAIIHEAGVTDFTGDASSFTGGVYLIGGTLYANTNFGGGVQAMGGTLGGSGALGPIVIGSGARLAPGNSVGTLNVASAAFTSGSTYEVELNDGGFVAGTNNDLLNASGTITIAGGDVLVTPENGTDDGSSYSLGSHTIASATGGVTGEFDSVSDDYLFLDFALGYDANNVYLTSSQAVLFGDYAETPNQIATAAAVEGLGSGNAVYDAMAFLTGSPDDARAALDGLSGALHASLGTVLVEDSRFPREAALGRLRTTRSGEIGGTLSTKSAALPAFDFWAEGYGAIGSIASDGNAPKLNRGTGGMVIGADTPLAGDVQLGLLAGFGSSTLREPATGSSAHFNSYSVGVYGATQLDRLSLRGGAVYGWHDITTRRDFAFGSFAASPRAQYNAQTVQVFGEAGYRVDLGSVALEPYLGLARIWQRGGAIAETGGAAALSGAAQSVQRTAVTAGVRAQTEVALGNGLTAELSGGIGWRHMLGATTPTRDLAFAGGSPFSISGVPIAGDALALDLGAEVALSPASTLSLSYSGTLARGASDHELGIGFSMNF